MVQVKLNLFWPVLLTHLAILTSLEATTNGDYCALHMFTMLH